MNINAVLFAVLFADFFADFSAAFFAALPAALRAARSAVAVAAVSTLLAIVPAGAEASAHASAPASAPANDVEANGPPVSPFLSVSDNDDLLHLVADTIGEHAVLFHVGGLVILLAFTACIWFALRSPAWARVGDSLRARVPAPSLLLGRGAAGLVIIVLAAVLFATIADHIGAGGKVAGADEALAETLRTRLPAHALRFYSWLTHAADSIVLTVLAMVVASALGVADQRRLAVGWVMAVGGNAILNPVLKRIFERVRPPHDAAFATESSWSFPSGHSSGAMVAYGMLAYLALRLLPDRWHLPAVMLAVAVIFTTGCSRIFLQVHYASDVAAGFASGLAWLMVCVMSMQAAHSRAATRT